MKKLLFVSTLMTIIAFTSCAGNNDSNINESEVTKGAPDSTPPPDGVVNSNAISTDTAAMNTSKMEQKKDSADRQDAKKR
ncbi:hypothetical protein EXU57_19880 [Segetibacter sp. 3557_3]|uniref:hypothetical protein n=1 Tax=Segetibacter sp. 3557_3 TaxID=2547429 RepID=UPI0010590C2B|nr:hypothetical protein [Segetibacter sp. 3557_3]TDH21456.1 hypothetical protein EXU57_19880 [Segetibacter sp. 3557_3]